MLTHADILSDKDVAKILHLSVGRFQERCRHGFRRGELDLMQAGPIVIGGMRRWFRADVERVIRERVVVA